MDYASNGSLKAILLEHGKLSEVQCKPIAAQILVALDFLHSRDIAHRDLKPDNILLDQNFDVKVADFGEAKKIMSQKV